MAWFRPARNRDHPGDPPPKWGLSRTGRIVVLVTVIAGVVIALLIMTSRTAGAADSADGAASQPEPSSELPWFGGRVEVPEAGFAATFPEGWVVVIDTSEPPEHTVRSVLTATRSRGQSCEVSLQGAASWNSLAEWAGTVLLRLRDYGPLDFESMGLPTGDAVRIEVALPAEEAFVVQYLLTDGASGFYSLVCQGADPPADRWRSIAESFEFLLADE